jgi:signal transduction histidine kinase
MGVATLAHEIRNAAHVVSLALKVARRDPARLGRSLDTAERQLVQLERLAGDLMDASRISQGRLSLHTERLNLVEVVRHAADGARAALEQAGHELSCELPAVPVVVRGDSGRLLQVIGNLLDNAIKYTPPGGHIGLQLTAGAAGAELVVRDDGAGIPPEKLDSVFDTFEQLGRSGGSGGVGIGLSLARSLVELHGGTLRAVSEGPGRGSEFRLWLPLAADAAA